jgi:tetratricopeptide (TPR) repeat protein
MGRYDKALADFDRAIELDPDYSWIIARRGETCRQMGRYEEALADFDCVIELDPDYAWAIAGRGETHRQMGRCQEALADFDCAIELDPDYAWTIARRGETYLLMERYEKALADFDRAIELDPDTDWYLYQRALTRQALGQPGEAQRDVNAAIKRAQELYVEDAEDWTNTLNLALYYLASEEAEEAERHYEAALSGDTSPDDIRMAVRDLGDFLSLFPDHPEARAMRDRLRQHLGEVDE